MCFMAVGHLKEKQLLKTLHEQGTHKTLRPINWAVGTIPIELLLTRIITRFNRHAVRRIKGF